MKSSNSDLARQGVTAIAILGAFLVNVLSNLFPLNGLNIGEISNTFFNDVRIIPASYAFAIWGLIYVGLFALGIYQALPAQRQNPRLRRMGYWLAIACASQSIWVLLFLSRQFLLSIVAMLGILIPLLLIYLRLEIGKTRPPRLERWLVDIPLSVYLGWISVATIVNVASALDDRGWNGGSLGAVGWTVIMLLVGAAIATVIALQWRDPAFVGVIVWAYVAIAVRQTENRAIAVTAIGLAIALGLLMLWSQLRPRRRLEAR
jgi:hypothetical protein